jgi:hypothetical protein
MITNLHPFAAINANATATQPPIVTTKKLAPLVGGITTTRNVPSQGNKENVSTVEAHIAQATEVVLNTTKLRKI